MTTVSDTWKRYLEESTIKTTFAEAIESLQESTGLETFQVRMPLNEISMMVELASKQRKTLDDVASDLVQMAWDFRTQYSRNRQEILDNMPDIRVDFESLKEDGETYFIRKDFLMDSELVRKTCIVGKSSKKNASGGEMPSALTRVVKGKREGLWFSTGVVLRMVLNNYSLFERHHRLVKASTERRLKEAEENV